MSMQGGNAFVAGIGGIHGWGRLHQVLIVGEVNRDSQLGSDGRLYHPENGSRTTNPHAFSQCDLRGHEECEFHTFSGGDGRIGEEKAATSAEILGETASLKLATRQFHGDGNVKFETLPDATLNPNWFRGHGFLG
jgi:hypothetical protein